MEFDTIVAIATPPGIGAVGIIRISGKNAIDVFNKIFRKARENWNSHQMYYGHVFTGIRESDIHVDEVIACVMRAPRSYTSEDVIEIYTHGGIITVHGVLEAAINNGARLALPGEFTKRAFFNGRINLTQAEAVMDLISAKTEAARKAGLKQLGGGLSKRISDARDELLMWLASIELSIDYPEHEEEAANLETILNQGRLWLERMTALQRTANLGRVLREGIKTAIIGKPNVGKSTLLNAIIGEDRAIVHEIPGTTRDVLSEQIRVGDVVLHLMDTAGIRETADPIEEIGVRKSYEAAQDAELILYIIDRSAPPSIDDIQIIEMLVDKNIIIVLNKCDLLTATNWSDVLPTAIQEYDIHEISAYTRQGLDNLFQDINRRFYEGQLSSDDTDIITRERHKILLGSAIDHVNRAMMDIENGVEEDLISIGLREAYSALGEILGLEIKDDIVDRIFSEFCVGK